jgi:hypothetical protein
MENTSEQDCGLYMGFIAMIASITFNIMYTSKSISIYEDRLTDLESKLANMEFRERYMKARFIRKIENLQFEMKNIIEKTEEIDKLVNILIDENIPDDESSQYTYSSSSSDISM